jgi:hypothetical protein
MGRTLLRSCHRILWAVSSAGDVGGFFDQTRSGFPVLHFAPTNSNSRGSIRAGRVRQAAVSSHRCHSGIYVSTGFTPAARTLDDDWFGQATDSGHPPASKTSATRIPYAKMVSLRSSSIALFSRNAAFGSTLTPMPNTTARGGRVSHVAIRAADWDASSHLYPGLGFVEKIPLGRTAQVCPSCSDTATELLEILQDAKESLAGGHTRTSDSSILRSRTDHHRRRNRPRASRRR